MFHNTISSQVTWKFQGKEISDGDHYTIQYSHGICTLEITRTKVDDTGKYTCLAENPLGEQETSCKVEVEGEIVCLLYIHFNIGSFATRCLRLILSYDFDKIVYRQSVYHGFDQMTLMVYGRDTLFMPLSEMYYYACAINLFKII